MRALSLGLAALLVSTVAAGAQTRSARAVIAVEAGKTVKVVGLAELKPDCTSMGPHRFAMAIKPSHGTLSFGRGKVTAKYPASSPFAVCNGRQVDGHEVSYTANKGYKGDDYIEFEAVGPSGTPTRVKVEVRVR